MKAIRRCLAMVLCLVLFGTSSGAWNGFGHMAVAYVAYKQLKPKTRKRALALIKLNPLYDKWVATLPADASDSDKDMMLFMIAATWPDQIRGDKSYKSDGTEGGNRPDDKTGALNIGYKDKNLHKYWHFVDQPFSTDGTTLGDIPSPNAATQIVAFTKTLGSNASDNVKSYDLVWLLHMVGDVHQPLHCAARYSKDLPHGDQGGNKVTLCKQPCKNELHALWDAGVGRGDDPAAVVKVAKRLGAADATLATEKDPSAWASESLELAKTVVYHDPIGEGAGPFTTTKDYQATVRKITGQRVALAGTRLANILNEQLK